MPKRSRSTVIATGFDGTLNWRWLALAAAAAGMTWAAPAQAQQAGGGGSRIISCRDAAGRIIKTDRLSDCNNSVTERNIDGSFKREVPPPLSPDELAAQQECERRNAELQSQQRDDLRRDRVLVNKFPNEARHQQAREKALDDVRKSVGQSEERIRGLIKDRKPLLEEAEFYKGKPLPPMLKQQLDSNDALLNAQKVLAQNQQAEAIRINARFDGQLTTLRKLWASGPPLPLPPLDCSASAIRKDR